MFFLLKKKITLNIDTALFKITIIQIIDDSVQEEKYNYKSDGDRKRKLKRNNNVQVPDTSGCLI